jgi:hypothetical protein
MMLELNYIVVPNNIEIGGGGLSQIFCGRLLVKVLIRFTRRQNSSRISNSKQDIRTAENDKIITTLMYSCV